MLARFTAPLARVCMYFAVAGLIGIVAVVAIQVFGRYVLNDTPVWAESTAMLLVLYVTMLGAAVGVRDAGHIGMESLLVLVPEKVRLKIELVIHAFDAAFGAMMAWNGGYLAWSVHGYKVPTLGISEGLNYLPMTISGVLILLFSIEHIIALLLGVPVAFAIGLSAVCTILYEGLPLAVVFQQMRSGMNIFSFLAIPFFIFAGELMLYGGIADRIVRFAKALVGHIRGGLGMSNVVACTLFGGISGSAVADVSAMGAVMIPMMKKEGYDADYAVNVTTHAALVGVLMPTSHNMIIYSLAAGGKVSIAALILAGLVPAMLLTASNLSAAYLVAIKRGYPAGMFPGWDRVARSLAAAVPGLAVVAIIIVGILSGVFTATESAAIAVIYALVLTLFVYRSMTWKNFLKAGAKAVKTTGEIGRAHV